MQRRTTVVAAALLAVAIAVAAGAALAANGGSDSADPQTITVSGTGEIDAQPDAAKVQLSVTARGGDAATVGNEVASGAEQLRSTLAEFGVADDNVQTQRYTIREDPQSRDAPDETVYVGQQTFEVTLEDVDRVGALIDAAVAGGADDVGGVHYTLSEDRRNAIRDDAIRAGISEARSEATVIADATGLATTGVRSASTVGSDVRPYRAEVTDLAASGDAGTEIDPQDVTVSATVEVTFGATGA